MGTHDHSFSSSCSILPWQLAAVVVAVVDGGKEGKKGKEIVVWPSGKGRRKRDDHQFHRRILRPTPTDRDFPPIFAAEK